MRSEMVGLIGVMVLVLLMFSGMWIGMAMLFVGVLGLVILNGFHGALGVLANVPYSAIADYPLTSLPLFMFMGAVLSNTRVGEDLYDTAYKWIGQLRGGLAMATVAACAGFATISGSSTATAVTMGKVALPEMKKYQYDDRLATGCAAAGGTIGILIPPSMGFILYGILTGVSIGKLFMAGIIPGILQAAFYIVTIYIMCRLNTQLGPAAQKTSAKEKLISLKNIWPALILFLLVIGGLYGGVFTPTEAAAVGAFGAIAITFIYGRLKGRNFISSMLMTGKIIAMIMLLIVGAFVFSHFIAVSKLPFMLSEFVTGLHVSKYYILVAVIVLYVLLGMFLDIMSSMILTIPILLPVIISLGFDQIWYGVIMVRLMEVGLISPPVGMNVFVLAGVTDVPIGTIFRGVIPFIVADIFHIGLLIAFPSLSLLLPNMMS